MASFYSAKLLYIIIDALMCQLCFNIVTGQDNYQELILTKLYIVE